MNGSQRFLSRRYMDVRSLVSQRMQIPHHRLGAFVEYVRIDLGRRNIGMAEQVLYDTKIGAVLQEMAGESLAGEMAALAVGGEEPGALGESRRLRFKRLAIALDGRARRLGNRDE